MTRHVVAHDRAWSGVSNMPLSRYVADHSVTPVAFAVQETRLDLHVSAKGTETVSQHAGVKERRSKTLSVTGAIVPGGNPSEVLICARLGLQTVMLRVR